jgi:replicative DNA helicase
VRIEYHRIMDLKEQRAEFPTATVRRFAEAMSRLVSRVRAVIARPEILDTEVMTVLVAMIEEIIGVLDDSGSEEAVAVTDTLERAVNELERIPVGREVTERVSVLLRELLDG